MAYDEGLAERIRNVLEDARGVTEKKMFGGFAFLWHGHMFVGTAKGKLMVRVGPERYDALLKQRHVRPMDFTGKPMRGYIFVDAAGYAEDRDLARFVRLGLELVATLPKKKPGARSPKSRPPRRG
jgi:TfoX/Sxy family transcriptional regulator of competence genes